MHNFKLRLLALLLLAVLSLSACSHGTQVSSEDAAIILPEPETSEISAVYGDSDRSEPEDVTIYYVSDGRYALTSVTSSINVDSDEDLIGNVLSELFNASAGAMPHSAASGAHLLSYEYSCGTVTVNLSIDSMLYQNEIEGQLFIASIVNTLLDIEGVDAVNILVGDRSISMCQLPAGVYTAANENIPASYAQLESEAERFLSGESDAVSRNALLYFPSENGEYMLPEIREIEFCSQDYIPMLIDALKEGPLTESASVSSIPESAELFNAEPSLEVTATGERIIQLDFNSLMLNYLAFAGLEEWELYGSIVLTLTSFLPEIDAVCIMIDGSKLESCRLPDRILQLEGGLMRRSDFSARIGSAARFCFANEAGSLSWKRCALSQLGATSPKRLLSGLIRTQPGQPGLSSVFPEGVNPEDILGVQVSERIASVNLSANFYARCQSLDAARERRLIYAMVNTLAELKNIGAVKFYVEGRSIDTLCGGIYLKTALLPDPGLMAE